MPLYRYRIADDVDSDRLAVGASGVDFVLGEGDDAVETFETRDASVASVLATLPQLEQEVIEDPDDAPEVVEQVEVAAEHAEYARPDVSNYSADAEAGDEV